MGTYITILFFRQLPCYYHSVDILIANNYKGITINDHVNIFKFVSWLLFLVSGPLLLLILVVVCYYHDVPFVITTNYNYHYYHYLVITLVITWYYLTITALFPSCYHTITILLSCCNVKCNHLLFLGFLLQLKLTLKQLKQPPGNLLFIVP